MPFPDIKPKDLLKHLRLKDKTVEPDINIPDSFSEPAEPGAGSGLSL